MTRYSLSALTILLTGLVAACGPADGNAVEDESLLRLTEVAEGEPGDPNSSPAIQSDENAGDAEGEFQSQDPTSEADLLDTEGLPPTPTAFGGEASNPLDSEGADASVRATSEAANLAEGIADVTDLIYDMPPLATFTPNPSAELPEGRLLYLRNGAFYEADAERGGGERLELPEDVPSVWGPPEDPGRAWLSPDGKDIAFFGGADAEMWMISSDGSSANAVSGNNLPDEQHAVSGAGVEGESVRLRPETDYTLIYTGGDPALTVLRDDNNYERRGNGRLRFVHAYENAADDTVQAIVNDTPFGRPMSFGGASGALSIPAGPVRVRLVNSAGDTVSDIPEFNIESKAVMTVFLYGDDQLKVSPTVYESSEPPGGFARVRVFNGSGAEVDLQLDEAQSLVGGLEAGKLGPYVRVKATLPNDERRQLQVDLYGNRAAEEPVAWSPDGEFLAFIGGPDGQPDLYVTNPAGDLRRVSQDPEREINPTWSPDGRRLVWLSEDLSFVSYQLKYFDLGSGEVEQHDFGPVRQAHGLAPTDKIFIPADPIWLDEDRFIIYPKFEQAVLGVWQVNAADGSMRQLYEGLVEDADWSDEARALVFNPDRDTGTIYKLDADGELSTLAEGEAYAPLWSPDGEWISYVEGHRTDESGWALKSIKADGSDESTLSGKLPLVQAKPPVPGPYAKRWWLDDGKTLAFTRVGKDYGAAERAGLARRQEAGPDIENIFTVPIDGSEEPQALSDLRQVYYLDKIRANDSGDGVAIVGLWYQSRTQQLWTVHPNRGGSPVQIDGPVRWYEWID